jgi:hypothetical protein
VNTSHPGNEGFGILKRPTALPEIHPGEKDIPRVDEVRRELVHRCHINRLYRGASSPPIPHGALPSVPPPPAGVGAGGSA